MNIGSYFLSFSTLIHLINGYWLILTSEQYCAGCLGVLPYTDPTPSPTAFLALSSFHTAGLSSRRRSNAWLFLQMRHIYYRFPVSIPGDIAILLMWAWSLSELVISSSLTPQVQLISFALFLPSVSHFQLHCHLCLRPSIDLRITQQPSSCCRLCVLPISNPIHFHSQIHLSVDQRLLIWLWQSPAQKPPMVPFVYRIV